MKCIEEYSGASHPCQQTIQPPVTENQPEPSCR